MKLSSVLATLGLAALVSTQSLPPCAQTCALNAIGATGCAATDAACVCTNPDFLTSSQTCIEGACNPTDIQAALEFAVSFCASGNVTITIPSGSGSATPTPTPSTSPESSPPASSTAAPESTEAPTTSSAAPSSTESTPSATESSEEPPPATSEAAAETSNAAMPLQNNLAGGLMALGLGVVAAL